MKRRNAESIIDPGDLAIYIEMVAFHEAGHAVAICLNNRLKQLPAIFLKSFLPILMSSR